MLRSLRAGHVSALVVCAAVGCAPEFTAVTDDAHAGAGGTNSFGGEGGTAGSAVSGGAGGKGGKGGTGAGGSTTGGTGRTGGSGATEGSAATGGQATGGESTGGQAMAGAAGDPGSGAVGGDATGGSGGSGGSGGGSGGGTSGGDGGATGGGGGAGSGGQAGAGAGGNGGGSGTGGSGQAGAGAGVGGNGGGSGTGGSGTGGGGSGGTGGGSGGFAGSEPVGGCENQLLANADFEAGPTPSWVESTTWPGLTIVVHGNDTDLVAEGVAPFAGNYLAWLGGVPDNEWDHNMVILRQDVFIPAEASALTLSGRYLIRSVDDPSEEYDEAYLEFETDEGTMWQAQRWTNQDTTNGWTAFERSTSDLDQLGGRTVTFVAYARTDPTGKTSVFLDSLRLEAACGR